MTSYVSENTWFSFHSMMYKWSNIDILSTTDIDYDVGPINHTNPTAIHPNDQPTEDQSSLSREFFNKMSLGLQNAFNHAIEESIEELSFNNNLFYEGCWL